jgi:hypothetical protein
MRRIEWMVCGTFLSLCVAVADVHAGDPDTLIVNEDFRPGDTLRYTTDGTLPTRSSAFVLFGANRIPVTRTTTFLARLYRPGFPPTAVQSRTVVARDTTTRTLVVPKK